MLAAMRALREHTIAAHEAAKKTALERAEATGKRPPILMHTRCPCVGIPVFMREGVGR